MPKKSNNKNKKSNRLATAAASTWRKRPLLVLFVGLNLIAGILFIATSLAAPKSNPYTSSCMKGRSTYPTIGSGNAGNCVKAVQWYLNQSDTTPSTRPTAASKYRTCSKVKIDGIYGSATKAAVTKFQQGHTLNRKGEKTQKLLVDGVTGPQTWSALTIYRSKVTGKTDKCGV